MKAKFLRIYRKITKNRLLNIYLGGNLQHWGIPFSVKYLSIAAFRVYLLQIQLFCFFLEVEWIKLEEKGSEKLSECESEVRDAEEAI